MDIFETDSGALFFAQDDMIVSWIRREGRPFEPETAAWISRKMLTLESGPARHFVDVGASTGWYTVPMALALNAVTAFEPNSRVLERLHANLELNKITRGVRVVPCAVSDAHGEAEFFYNPNVPLTSGGSIEAPTCRAPRREMVPVVTLDDALAGQQVGMIKIDVENHELSVLNGAREVIARERPFLILEGNTIRLQERLIRVVRDMGYAVKQADERNLLCEFGA